MDVKDYAPALPMLKLEAGGEPWLAGSGCSACGAVFTSERAVCASCGGRDTIKPMRLAERGTLYNYTIVYRSYPGVPTPFISAIVDLEGGGSLRGTLLDVEADPEKIARDLPVKLVFRETSQKSKEGKPFLAYYFVPAKEDAA